MLYFSLSNKSFRIAITYCLVFLSSTLNAASSEFLSIEKVIYKNQINTVFPYVINLVSHNKGIDKTKLKLIPKLKSNLVYISRISINNRQYFRLSSGNFKHKIEASKALKHYIKYFKGAWINKRTDKEKQLLLKSIKSKPLITKKAKPVTIKTTNKSKQFAKQLLVKMEGYFLAGHFSRVITSANKVLEIGNTLQQQKAMELLGIARERQGKFAQAISVYKEFLLRFPNSKLNDKINNRLLGLKTMRLTPKKRLVKRTSKRNNNEWTTYGSISQYYRKDVIDEATEGTQTQNSSLLTDLNAFARKNNDTSRIELRFDGGLINDFLDDSSDARISRASISYTDKEANYKVVSGRQSRTAKGVFGRFDGFVFTSYSDTFNYSLFTGSPVFSTGDSVNSNSQFIGSSINFKFLEDITTDIYLVQQRIDGLTDRQAIGSEMQYINDKGFFYGILDYDIFYNDLNNLTLISNYRHSEKLSFNITFDYRNSPFLTTLNALQGQAVESIEDLKNTFSDSEIYSLAQDRTSKSTNLFISSNYQIDSSRQVYLSMSLSSIEATVSSAGVLAMPKSNYLYLSADYTIKNYFNLNDYSTIGARLSQSTTSETFSINSRTQFYDDRKIRYKPRFNIDYRLNKNTDLTQWILKPSLKLTYKSNKKVSFEGELGLEFSDFNLPEQDKQSSYNLFVGYLYLFD